MSPQNLSQLALLSTQEFRLTRAMIRHVRSGRADEEIDKRVYVLYGLSPDEINIIEGKE